MLDKITEWHFHNTSYEGIWPTKISNFMQGLKSAILAVFRMGRDGRALLVRPSRIPHRNFKNLFALGAAESLERVEGKTGEAPFFYRSNLVKNRAQCPI